ncbi:MAG: hypothetical protein ACRDRW_14405 [Pseudonocardiaceae bacterium]
MAGSSVAKLPGADWVVVGAALLAYISSYLPWRTTHVSILGANPSPYAKDAWNAGFGAWFSVLLLVAAGGVVLLSTVSGRLRLATSRSLIILVLSVLASVTIVLRWVTLPGSGDGPGRLGLGELGEVDLGSVVTVTSGAGVGLYLGLIAAIAAVVASLLTFRATGRNVDHTS